MTPAAFRKYAYSFVREDVRSYEELRLFDTSSLPAAAQEYARILCSALTAYLEESVDPSHQIQFRYKLIKQLTLKKLKLADRRERGVAMLVENMRLILGWDEMLTFCDEDPMAIGYQFDRARAWWCARPLEWQHTTLKEIENQHGVMTPQAITELEAQGFTLVDQAGYRGRIEHEVLNELLVYRQSRLHWMVRLVLLFTSSDAVIEPGQTSMMLYPHEDRVAALAARITKEFTDRLRPVWVALPREPLATLSSEANTMGLIAAGKPPQKAGLRLYEEDGNGQLSLLMYDRDLVVKPSGLPDTYIRIPLNDPETTLESDVSPLQVLLQVLGGLAEQEPVTRQTHMRDIPRVVAGMFLAATQDEHLDLPGLHPGHFVDSASALRLTGLVGYERTQNRYTKRVRTVRDWLTTIELSRRVYRLNPKTKQRDYINWTAPLVQKLADRIEFGSELPDGLHRSRSEVSIFRLAPELWNMRTPDSGCANFMLVDQRAFDLPTANNEAFNLYWTIIQRAYRAGEASSPEERFTAEGIFSPRAKMLYRWSGMELESDKKQPYRIRVRMRQWLEQMVDLGLICDWTSEMIENDDMIFSSEKFENERIRIKLPTTLLQYLSAHSFIQENNPFRSPHLPG